MSGYNEIHTQLLLQDLLNEMVAGRADSATLDERLTTIESVATSLSTEVDTISEDVDTISIGIYYASNYSSFAAAVTAIGSTVATLVVADSQTITASLDVATLAPNTTVVIIGGGYFTGESAVTLNLGKFEAPRRQVFYGLTVTFGAGAVDAVKPEWWTTNTTPGTTDMTNAFTAAIAAMNTGMCLEAPGQYAISSGISIGVTGYRFNIGDLTYTGTEGAAVTVGGGISSADTISGFINSITLSSQDWDTASVGLRVAGLRFGKIDVRKISKFQHAVGVGYTGSATTYFNQISIGRTENCQIHLSFDGDEGETNGNTFIGPTCYDNNYASHAQYAASYGVYIPDGSTSFSNGNTFISLGFNWLGGSEGHIVNDIYCGGKYNTFINPRFADGLTSDARIRFSSVSVGNILLNSYTHDVIYDESGNNTIISSGITQQNGFSIHATADYNTSYQTYRSGDIWVNKDYDDQADSPRKICITPGTYWGTITTTASTTALDATVTLSVPGDIRTGTYINIAGVTGPLEVLSRDYLNSTVEVDPAPDATVTDAEVTYATPTFADETPASIRGYKTWNPGSIADGDSETTTLTVTGAELGNMVIVGPGVDAAGLTPFGYVSAADTVTIGLSNNTGDAVDLASSTWSVRVFKY